MLDTETVRCWCTAADIAHMFRVPIGTVHRWASEDKWPRITGRPTLYDIDSASTSHRRRRAAAA